MEQNGTRPLIIAHRGASAVAPENTLAAIRAALELDADGVEFDVRLAKDGVPVVIHDPSLKRGAGITGKVEEFTSAQLGRLDAGSWFNARRPSLAKREYSKERVPTLANVLQSLRGFNGPVYLELKCGRDHVTLVSAVTDLLSDTQQDFIIKSFRLAAIGEIRRRMPAVETAALFGPSIVGRARQYIERAMECGATQLSLHRSLLTAKLAALALDANMPVTVWTADDPKWIGRALKYGVKALITNDPSLMIAARNEHSQNNI